MSLSQLILDEIDGAEECRGRDSQLSDWSRQAEALEVRVEYLQMCLERAETAARLNGETIAAMQS